MTSQRPAQAEDRMAAGPLVDRFGRIHTNLRISVTDRCNIRCFYCMPDGPVTFRPKAELLTFEEITRFARVMIQLGVIRFRLTGGEPLARSGLPVLVEMLAGLTGLGDLALTTNGMLLAECAGDLRRAGLRRINISLDTLDEERFRAITRRRGLHRVLEGIAAAQQAGFSRIRLNCVAVRGLTEREISALVRFARQRRLELRFIEFMPLDADQHWTSADVLAGRDIRRHVEQEFGPLLPAQRRDPSQPAVDYVFADGGGRIGFINPVSEPFCGNCTRLRLTAEGQVRNCLFSQTEWDARSIMRNGGTDRDLAALVQACVDQKKAGHGIDSPDFLRPQRAMYQIGG
jgi:cyclic pyranopterin phosphate synthase